MARPVRTIVLVVAMAVAALAIPASANAAGLGDLLGIITGGSGSPSEPPPDQPPSRPPEPGGQPVNSPLPEGQPLPQRSKLLAPESSCPGQTDPTLSTAARERAMACMESYARVAKHRSPLRVFKPLRISATHKARDIRHCQKLSHTACGRDPWYWIQRVGFFRGSWAAGEVLAVEGGERGTVRGTMRAWLGSTTHRQVILHPGFNLVGVGSLKARFHGFRHMTIWVAHLGYQH